MMLNAKIQVALNLKEKFQKIIESNPDKFETQMLTDMKNLISLANKENGVSMNLEKQIIQNFSNSEKWFIKAYQALKKVVGGGNIMVDIDFKEFTEILACIKGDDQQMKEMYELIDMCKGTVGLPYINETESKIPKLSATNNEIQEGSLTLKKSFSQASAGKEINSSGSKGTQKLVCAAHNLQLSLLRCKWMIQVQQVIGFGQFSKRNQSQQLQENQQREFQGISNLKQKDVRDICRLSDEIQDLGIEDIIENFDADEESELSIIIQEMNQLSIFSKQYQSLFGQKELTPNHQFGRISEMIDKCERSLKEKTNLNSNIKQELEKAVDFLTKLHDDLETLDTMREQLNIVNNEVQEDQKLEAIFKQAITQVKFSKQFNFEKLQNAPSCKLTINQSFQLLEEAQKNPNIAKDSHIMKKLQRNIQKFEMFGRNYGEYMKFKKRQKQQIKDDPEGGFAREQCDLRFKYEFVQGLIKDAEHIDIDIFSSKDNDKPSTQTNDLSSKFDIGILKRDIQQYNKFKDEFVILLTQLQHEIFEKQSSQVIDELKSSGIIDEFEKKRIQITLLPIYDKATYRLIKAFVWIFNAYDLISTGQIDPDSPFYSLQQDDRINQNEQIQLMTINQWKEFIKNHKNFLGILPELKNHSVLQQLQWQVDLAQSLIDDVKNQKNTIKIFNQLFNRGADYWKARGDDDEFMDDGQFENSKKGFFTNTIGEKLMDLQSHQNQRMGIIGPNLPKDRLMNQFKKKQIIEDFKQKRFDAETKLKINLTDEIRYLNKWITEYEDLVQYKKPILSNSIKEELIKKMEDNQEEHNLREQSPATRKQSKPQQPVQQFAYQPLFEQFQYEDLKLKAKQVFMSPIYNWSLWCILKKRLETSYQIKQDFKYMILEKDQKGQQERIKITRIQPYLTQYYQNCRVKGIQEIDKMLSIIENNKAILAEIQELLKETKCEVGFLNKLRSLRSRLEIDFEDEEVQIRIQEWKIQAQIIETQKEYILEAEEFVEFNSEFIKLKIKKQSDFQTEWYQSFKIDILDAIEKITNSRKKEELEEMQIKLSPDLKIKNVNFSQFIEDKMAKLQMKKKNTIGLQSISSGQSLKNSKISNKKSGSNPSSGSSSSGSSGSSSSGSNSSSGGSKSQSSLSDKFKCSVDSSSNSDEISGDSVSSKEGPQTNQQKKVKRQEATKIQKLEDGTFVKVGSATDKSRNQAKENNKRAQKSFDKQQKRERDRRLEGVGKTEEHIGLKDQKNDQNWVRNQFLSTSTHNDRVLQDAQRLIQQNVRGESNIKIIKALTMLKDTLKINTQDKNREESTFLEADCFKISLGKVDETYGKKIQNIIKNLKYLETTAELSDLTDRIMIRKNISQLKLRNPHPVFRDFATEVQEKINERKRFRKAPTSSSNAGVIGTKLKQNTRSAENYFNDILGRETQYDDQDEKMESAQKQNQIEERKQIEKKPPVAQVKQQDTQGSRNDFSDNFSQVSEDPDGNFSENDNDVNMRDDQVRGGDTEYINPLLIENQEIYEKKTKAPVIKYNPMSAIRPYNQYEQEVSYYGDYHQVIEDDYPPVLYDPIKKKCAVEKQFYEKQRKIYQEKKAQVQQQYVDKMELKENRKIEASQQLNQAEPGSLLKVWEGKLDLIGQAKKAINGYSKITNIINVDFWSCQDINYYQTIPDWPTCLLNNFSSVQGALSLKGKAETQEVMKHFTLLEKDQKKILSGWVTINFGGKRDQQINNDQFSNLYQELSSSNKCSLFVLYDSFKQPSKQIEIKEVHIYLLPICEQTIEFCTQMGIIPTNDHLIKNPQMFAYLINIKHMNYSGIQKMQISQSGNPSLNPICVIEAQELKRLKMPEMPAIDQTHRVVKQEPMDNHFYQHQQPASYQFNEHELEQERQIDEMIHNLKTNKVEYKQIMQAILPYIEQKNISKRGEQKLNNFINELIKQKEVEDQIHKTVKRESNEQQHQHQLQPPQSVNNQYTQQYNPHQQHQQMQQQQQAPQLNQEQIQNLMLLNSQGLLTPQQQITLQQQIALLSQMESQQHQQQQQQQQNPYQNNGQNYHHQY